MKATVLYTLSPTTLTIAGVTFALLIGIAISAVISRARGKPSATHVSWLKGLSVWSALAGLVSFSHGMTRTLAGYSLGGAPIEGLWKWQSRNYSILRLWMLLALFAWTCVLLLKIWKDKTPTKPSALQDSPRGGGSF